MSQEMLSYNRAAADRVKRANFRAEQKRRHEAEIAMLSARWLRKANGRLTLKDARELAERQSGSYRYGFWGNDQIAFRTPGWLKESYTEALDSHPSHMAALRTRLTRADDLFGCGPTAGRLWPGDSLVWDPAWTSPYSPHVGAWVVKRGNG
jgi:hypothetical protein